MPAAIFDLDGTLIDSRGAHFLAWRSIAAELGHELGDAEFSRYFGLKNEPILAALHDTIGRPIPPPNELDAIAMEKEVRFRSALTEACFPFMPGVLDLLTALRSGGWQLAVGSSAPRENIDFALERFTTAGQPFDAVACGCDVTAGKPAPDVFLLAASRLEADPCACVVFEDAPAGVEAARRAGMACVAVASEGRPPGDLADADTVIHDFHDLTPEALAALL